MGSTWVPSPVTKVMVYWFTIHLAYRVRFSAGMVVKSTGSPVNVLSRYQPPKV